METIGANIFVETVYPGVNVGCVITEGGAVCIDTPLLPAEAQRWMARIESWGAELVRFVVYTTGHSERVLGTQYLMSEQQAFPVQPTQPVRQVSPVARIPPPRFAPPAAPEPSRQSRVGAVVAHQLAWETVEELCADSFKQSLVDLLGDRDPDMVNLEVILPQITFDEQIELFAGDTTVTLLAAAGGALWAWFPKEGVLFTGDSVVVGTHPPLNAIEIQGWLAALERLGKDPRFQDIVLVPGRGPLCDTLAAEPLASYLRLACDRTMKIFESGRPKADLNSVAAELVPLYPVPDGQRERVQRQIKLALDDLYDAFRTADAVTE
jgi:glyoxylase-like metal-dependent hydrolase (beta-lactamase superfamily II)